MADPLSEEASPSRFFPDDLNSFDAEQSVGVLPSPMLLWSPSADVHSGKFRTQLLVLALSKPGRQLVHNFREKQLTGSVLQPGISMVGNRLEGGVDEKACYVYSSSGTGSTLWISVQYSVPAEHASVWTKGLFKAIEADRVIILGDVLSQHFRGGLSADEERVFFLETDAEKKNRKNTAVAPYFPSGSLVDGLSAAILSYCQMRSMKGRLVVTWPQLYNPAALATVVTELLKSASEQVPAWNLAAVQKNHTRTHHDSLLYV